MATHRDREVYPPVITDGLPSTVLEYDDPFWDLLSRGTLVGSANLPVTTTRTGSRKSVDSATDTIVGVNLVDTDLENDWTNNGNLTVVGSGGVFTITLDGTTAIAAIYYAIASAANNRVMKMQARLISGSIPSNPAGTYIAFRNSGDLKGTVYDTSKIGASWTDVECSVTSADTTDLAYFRFDNIAAAVIEVRYVRAMDTADSNLPIFPDGSAAGAVATDLFYHSGLPVIGVMNGATNLVDTDLTNWTQTSLAITEPSTGVYRVTVPASSTSYANVAIAGGFINRIGSFQARLISGTPAGTCYMTFANGGSSTGVNASFIGLGADWTPLEFSRTSATNTDGVFLYALSQPTEVVIEIRYIRAVDSTVAHPAFPDGSAAAAAYGIDTVLCLPTWAANGTLVQAIVPYGYTGNGPSGAGARIYEQNNGLAYRPSSIIVAGSGGAPSLNDGTGVSEGSVTVLSMDWDGVDIGARFDDGTRLTATEADTPAGALAIGVTQGGLTPFHGALLSVKYDYVLPDAQYEILRVGFTNLLSTFTFR